LVGMTASLSAGEHRMVALTPTRHNQVRSGGDRYEPPRQKPARPRRRGHGASRQSVGAYGLTVAVTLGAVSAVDHVYQRRSRLARALLTRSLLTSALLTQVLSA